MLLDIFEYRNKRDIGHIIRVSDWTFKHSILIGPISQKPDDPPLPIQTGEHCRKPQVILSFVVELAAGVSLLMTTSY